MRGPRPKVAGPARTYGVHRPAAAIRPASTCPTVRPTGRGR